MQINYSSKMLFPLFVVLFIFLLVQKAFSTVDIYPLPPNATKSSVFSSTVDNEEANVIKYMDYHYMHIGFDNNVSITITANTKINTFKISPLSLNIEATVDNNKLTFNLSQVLSDDSTPRYLVIQINNLEKLVILADRPEINAPTAHGNGVYLVTAAPYSADSTGVIFAQNSIQQAINDASNAGGGIVYVPFGLYLIKENLSIKSNVELYLAPGSVLKAIDDRSQYAQNSTISPAVIINRASNVKISGRGEIDASGYKLMSPPAGFTSQSVEHPRRRAVQLDYSSNIDLKGIIVKDATGWTIELMRSTDLIVQNVKVLNHKDINYKIENDGIDAVSSSNTVINQCFVITIDDAYCSKARYTDMDNCVFSNNVSYNWSGGVKAGMQSVGDMTNILFRNCDVIHCRRGVAIDTREGTKPIENVEFRDIRVEETSSTISGSNYLVEFESKLALISDIKIVRLTSFENNKMKFAGSFDISNVEFEDLIVNDDTIASGAQLNITNGSGIAVTYNFSTTNSNNEPDETHLIVNPSFEYKSENELNDGTTFKGTPYGWFNTTFTGDSYGINSDAKEKDGNNVCWYQSSPMPTDFELYQNIVGLLAGEYTVSCRLAVDNGKLTTQRLFANNDVQYYGYPSNYNLNLNSNEKYSFASWDTPSSSPLGLREMKVNAVIKEGETLKIGIRTSSKKADGNPATNNAGWFKVDNFRLKLRELHGQTGVAKTENKSFKIWGETGVCHINFKEPINSANIRIFSLTGAVVHSKDTNNQNTQIKLNKGLYLVQVSLADEISNYKVLVL